MKFETPVEKSDYPTAQLTGDNVQIIENEDGSCNILFSDELIAQLGWEVGDVIEWNLENDSVVISKKGKKDETNPNS